MIVLTVLLWVGRILLGLLALILVLVLLISLVPVHLKVQYTPAGFNAMLRILFYRRVLAGPGESDKSEKKKSKTGHKFFKKKAAAAKQSEQEKHTEKQTTDSAKSKETVRHVLENLPELLGVGTHFLGVVLRSLHISHISVVVPITAQQADEVARNVGKANAWFYAIATALERGMKLSWQEVRFLPDYHDEYGDSLLLSACISGCLLPVLIAAVHLLVGLRRMDII